MGRGDVGAVLVEEDTPPAQEVAAVADNLDASLRVVTVQPIKNLMVCQCSVSSVSACLKKDVLVLTRENIALLKGDALRGPCPLDRVVVLFKSGSIGFCGRVWFCTNLIVGDGNGVVDDVADDPDLGP